VPHNLSSIMSQAISSINEGISIADIRDENNPLIYVNDGFLRITGYDRSDVMGRNCRFLQGPNTDKKTVDIIKNAILTKKSCSVTLLNYKKDGSKFWNRLSIVPLVGENGEVSHFAGIQCDISDIIKLKEELAGALSSLEEQHDCVKENLTSFENNLSSSIHQTNVKAKALKNKKCISDRDVEILLRDIAHSMNEVNELVLNLRASSKLLGGLDELHKYDLSSFKKK